MGQHCELAYKIIEEKGWHDELEEWEKTHQGYPVDFLHEVKRYARYMGWGSTPHWVLPKGNLTRRQQERIFELDNKLN
jgi:hypothetical protein